VFAPLSDHILTGHESGKIAKYDAKTGEEVLKVEESHSGEITDIQLSPDGTYFITSSKDKSARVSLGCVWSVNDRGVWIIPVWACFACGTGRDKARWDAGRMGWRDGLRAVARLNS